MDQLDELQACLRRLLKLVDAPAGPGQPSWQVNALATIRQNVVSYLAGLKAATANAPEDRLKAACRVSGIRKGVSDLGLFRSDHPVMQMADEADTLATRICAARSPA